MEKVGSIEGIILRSHCLCISVDKGPSFEQILEMYVFSSRNCNPILVYDLYSFSLSITKPQRTYLGYKVYYFPLDVNVLQRN